MSFPTFKEPHIENWMVLAAYARQRQQELLLSAERAAKGRFWRRRRAPAPVPAVGRELRLSEDPAL